MGMFKFLKFEKNNKRILCVDFGESFIKVVFLEKRQNINYLLSYALAEFNAAQKTPEDISHFLSQLLENNSIAGKEVALSISDPDGIFIKKLTLPQMPKDELFNAVKWQLKGELAFTPDENISDFQIIREYTDSDGAKKIQLLCVFAKKETINKYIQAVTNCGLLANRVSTSVFNYCGTLNSFTAHPQVSAILDIAGTHSYIAIYQNNNLSSVRLLNFSTEKLRAALVGVLVTDKGRIEISLQKAKDLLAQFGMPLEESLVLENGIKAGNIISLIRPLLETLTKELERSFEYFKSESGLSVPETLYVTGGGANLKNLDTYLAGQLRIKVAKLPLPESLDVLKVDAHKLSLEANQLSGVLGLALVTGGINLLPREIKNQKLELIQQSTLRIAAVTIAAIFIFSWTVINFQIGDYKKRLTIARSHLLNVEEIKSSKEIVDLREGLIDRIHAGRVPAAGLLKLISAVIPPNIILNELSFDQSGHLMLLQGVVTLSRDSVEKVLMDFIKDLENSGFVHEANLVNSKEDQGINSFQIRCNLAK
jgi:type IV pilus assembly protein PilM